MNILNITYMVVTLYIYICMYACMYVCMCVCMFAIGARTAGPRELKFGTEVGFHPGSVFG